MPTTIRQKARPIEIVTPLGDDVVGLRSFVVRETLGQPFTILAELSSDDPDIKFDAIIGQPVVIRLNLAVGGVRLFHAYVSRFSAVGKSGRFHHYRAVLVPWLWFLSKSADCRIFQAKSAPDIVQQVLRDRGSKDFELRLSGTYPPREYCVQYRETDLNFVSRLLEDEGIGYYFKHTEDKATLILGDEKSAYEPAVAYETIPFRPPGTSDAHRESISSWLVEHELQTTQFALNDYNPLKPRTSLLNLAEVSREYAVNDRQMFDYPGAYDVAGEGDRLSNIRLQEQQASWQVICAECSCLGLGAGNVFKLEDHPRVEQNAEYLITELELFYDAGEFDSAVVASVSRCSFRCLPTEIPYRPVRQARRPYVRGPQPALVTGPSGEEIHTDEHGRIKVHFYWDREQPADDKSSCWVRVAQVWAGKQYGAFFLPRIGNEVLVDFLEGDPDRPVVVGSVYNGENKPPTTLPAEKTRSTIKTLSSKDGGGFNELRFEDKKGSEQIFLHAEKNLDVRVKNDAKTNILANEHRTVATDQFEKIGNDRHVEVVRDQMEKIGRDLFLKVAEKTAIEIGKTLSVTVGDDVAEVFKKNHHEKTAEQVFIEATTIVLNASDNITLSIGSNSTYIALTSDGVKISTGGKIVLDAGGDIEVKTKANLKAEAVANASIKGTAGLKLESPATADLKSTKTSVSGDGMLTLKGGMVMIN